MRSASLPPQSLTKAATSPSRSAWAAASRLSGTGDCEQPAKIRVPKVNKIDEWRFILIFPRLAVSVFFGSRFPGIIHLITEASHAGWRQLVGAQLVGARRSSCSQRLFGYERLPHFPRKNVCMSPVRTGQTEVPCPGCGGL